MAKGDRPKPPIPPVVNPPEVYFFDIVTNPPVVSDVVIGNLKYQTNSDGYLYVTDYPDVSLVNLQITANGYQVFNQSVSPAELQANNTLGNHNVFKLTPAIPSYTRDQICSVGVKLSGLTINTSQFGLQPWFEIAYQCLTDANDRASVRQQKKAAGDTHQILEFFTNSGLIYNEPNVWLNQCASPSGEQNPDWFKMLVLELLTDGLIPIVVFDGDNGDNPNDGYPNALRQLPILVNLLSEYNDKILYARFWDGVFYGSTPDNIEHFGYQFRTLLPNGYLAIEFNPGHIPVGSGPEDYKLNGAMYNYDVICGEFNWPNYHEDSTWQIVGRLVSPYNRPPDQPADDDPNPPFYLQGGTSRGKYYFVAFELGEYEWTRGQISYHDLVAAGQYFKSMGCTLIGFPS